ncbi:MAG: hypothetical protein AAF919_15460 [Pseudomonadota bacterium]
MHAHDMTSYHRADLQAQMERARAEVETKSAEARAFGEVAPKEGEPEWDMQLYHKGGYYAFIFCLWFAFVSPIVLILTLWD